MAAVANEVAVAARDAVAEAAGAVGGAVELRILGRKA